MHTDLELTAYLGDAKTLRIPMRWGNKAFAPADEWFLIFTVKADADTDTDAQAEIQKTSDLGITVSGSAALVSLIPRDTAGDADADPVVAALTPGAYDWDIQAQSIADPDDVRTVANGSLVLTRDVTRGTETAIPVYVASPGLTYDTQFVTYQ